MMRYELPAVVVEHRQRATNQYELILHAPPIAERATPGQFVMLRPMRTHAPLWRRPYSILRANPDKGVFSVFYSVQSAFTELLSLKPIGSTVQTLGPLGSYFVPVRTARRHILAAGGVGAPPLCFFASRLAPTLRAGEQLLILAGARRRDLLVGLDEFRALGAEVRIATDDGSQGYQGYVTDLLQDALQEPIPSAVYACGPNRMLQSCGANLYRAGRPVSSVAGRADAVWDGGLLGLRRQSRHARRRGVVQTRLHRRTRVPRGGGGLGMTPDLQVSLGKLHLRNPVMVAAGTFGYGLEYRDWVDLAQLGAVVTKSLTLAPRMGNPPPRVAETPAGMLNAIGLQNDGVDAFLVETLPRLRETGATVVASVAGETLDEYVQVAAKLARAEGVAALELNLSCPNQARGGMEFGVQPDLTAQVVAAVRQTTDLPLIAKLSPNGGDITPSAQAAVAGGADILCLINTLLGVAVDPQQAPVSPREQGRRAVGARDQAHRAVSPLARAPSLARYAPDWRRGHQQCGRCD